MSVLKLLALDSFYTVNKHLVKKFGYQAALIFADLASAQNYQAIQNQGFVDWFYRTQEKIEEETTLKEKQQRKAINILKEAKVLKTDLRGVPARKHFLIDFDCEQNLLNLFRQKCETRKAEKAELDQQKERNIYNKNTVSKNSSIKNKELNKHNKGEEASFSELTDKEIQLQEKNCAKKEVSESDLPDLSEMKPEGYSSSSWLNDFYQNNDIKHLIKFKNQPSKNYINNLLKELGEESTKILLQKVESYCIKKPSYSSERKNLGSVLGRFKKSLETPLEIKIKAIYSKHFKNLFGEEPEFYPKSINNIRDIITKLTKSLLNQQIEATAETIASSFDFLLDKLEDYRKKPENFKLALINYNLQSILIKAKQEHEKGTNNKKGIGEVGNLGF